ncbi:MAG TPA: hypothetical protein VN372_10175 [Methanospirillum sp.]|nr:hypothetical protein [Methanospirillum sp.]
MDAETLDAALLTTDLFYEKTLVAIAFKDVNTDFIIVPKGVTSFSKPTESPDIR